MHKDRTRIVGVDFYVPASWRDLLDKKRISATILNLIERTEILKGCHVLEYEKKSWWKWSKDFFLKMGVFSTWHYKFDKSIDGVLGTRTWGDNMEGADESTELWRHPWNKDFDRNMSPVKMWSHHRCHLTQQIVVDYIPNPRKWSLMVPK